MWKMASVSVLTRLYAEKENTSYELRIKIHELQVQIHELRVQIHELEH